MASVYTTHDTTALSRGQRLCRLHRQITMFSKPHTDAHTHIHTDLSHTHTHLKSPGPERALRSSDELLLVLPRPHFRSKGDQAVSGPKLWSSLPLHVRFCCLLHPEVWGRE